ncbi:hypothetical protein AB0H76_33340 [Nocardia sp. NPDC050712]|uniref:hypothetical protein n=1 Tax=Nocardia sp. NPDC050712 TaxID=3155518 RepID=UPI0033D5A106
MGEYFATALAHLSGLGTMVMALSMAMAQVAGPDAPLQLSALTQGLAGGAVTWVEENQAAESWFE